MAAAMRHPEANPIPDMHPDNITTNPPGPARARTLLGIELKKWDDDFRFLLDCLATALGRIGEGKLADFVSAVFSDRSEAAGDFPTRGAQALSLAFQLLTMTEENTANQVRRIRETVGGPASEPGTWPYQLQKLRAAGLDEEAVRQTLPSIHVQPVLTAHPTEAKRPSVLECHREIYLMLVERENPTRTPMEQQALRGRLEDSLERLWRAGEILPDRPNIESEIRNTLHYISHVFPGVMKLLSERFQQSWEWAFPGSAPPPEPRLSFGTWVGGDRDGHPFVTTRVTRHALEALRATALGVLRESLGTLASRLSLSEAVQPAPAGVYEHIARYAGMAGDDAPLPEDKDEPWRRLVSLMLARVPRPGDPRPPSYCYQNPDQLREDLEFLGDTLGQVGCLLYTSPSPRDPKTSRMPSSA